MNPQNEKHTFIKLVTENQNILHKICHFYCYQPQDKQDLYQEITLQLWKAFPKFREQARFSTWMYRIALNTAITMTRRPKIFQPLPEQQELIVMQDHNYLSDKDEDIRILYKAISRLEKVEKAIILLWLEEKPYREIASITGLSEKNISVKLVRIKQKLEKLIEELQ